MSAAFADRTEMQHRLFAELSAMFARETPMYDRMLLVNRLCNRAVCRVLERMHTGFSIDDAQLDLDSAERHGAIRIGTPEEYRWIARLFACFAMEPHGFYDMSALGAKSQPVIATAFRSTRNPSHRVFTSLLLVDAFDAPTAGQIRGLLERRRVFTDDARGLIERCEQRGGLTWDEAHELIGVCTRRIFRWTGTARDHGLYQRLCAAGSKIAADIACFDSHHLNHLTPNTFCMDLFTASMRFGMGELDRSAFRARARGSLGVIAEQTGRAARDELNLLLRHLGQSQIERFGTGRIDPAEIGTIIDRLEDGLMQEQVRMDRLAHSGFKRTTEGPDARTPVLLRQDSYRALSEPVVFTDPDGSTVHAQHTARFGEIEQRFYATTPAGRALYDACLERAECARAAHLDRHPGDEDGARAAYAGAFEPFPRTMLGLLDAGLIFGVYEPTDAGLSACGSIGTADRAELVRLGLVRVEGLRYEDFLPFSAAGIFASNLDQSGRSPGGTQSPAPTRADLEAIMGRRIIDPDAEAAGLEACSLLDTFRRLGVLGRVAIDELGALEAAAHTHDSIAGPGCVV